jgi:hypothetical protein
VRACGNSSDPNFSTASLAVYLHVMADSLVVALKWLAKIKLERTLPRRY